jgi:hypothetical protein
MHTHFWRNKTASHDSFFNPKQHLVTGAALVVAEILIKADRFHRPFFKETWDELSKELDDREYPASADRASQVDPAGPENRVLTQP